MRKLNHSSPKGEFKRAQREREAVIKAKDYQDSQKELLRFTVKAVLATAAAALLLSMFASCSPQRKANLCAEWATENPEFFKSKVDTFYQEVITPAEHEVFYLDIDSLRTTPIEREYKGAYFGFEIIENKLKFELNKPAQIDTVFIFRETVTPAQKRPVTFKNKYTYIGFSSGFLFCLGFIALMIIIRGRP